MQLTIPIPPPDVPSEPSKTLRDRALAVVNRCVDPDGLPPEAVASILGVSEKEVRDALWWLWCDGLVERNLMQYVPKNPDVRVFEKP